MTRSNKLTIRAWGDRIRELATHLLQHEEEFDQDLAWLGSDEAKSSAEFGVQIGGLDENLKFLDRVVTVCHSTRIADDVTRSLVETVEITADHNFGDRQRLRLTHLIVNLTALIF
ncbi:MAG: hypothetical protein LAO78_10430 [Acidobacteriia bacterium]|nr:hypothetical protein [Terriglobia bacterium]